MFLGLNRRAAGDDVRTVARGHDPRTIRPRRNIFSGSLSQGVLEAISLAENQHRDSLIEVGKAGDKLRRDMLIELLTVEKRSLGALSVPTTRELRQIPEMRRAIDPLAIVLGLPRETVSQKVGAFLDVLEESSKRIPPKVNLDRALAGSNDGDGSTTIDAIINWNINLPEIKRIKTLSEMVQSYNEKVKGITKDNTRYIELLGKFLEDSNKEVVFDEKGYICINVRKGNKKTQIFSLSSGESQIFIYSNSLVLQSSGPHK